MKSMVCPQSNALVSLELCLPHILIVILFPILLQILLLLGTASSTVYNTSYILSDSNAPRFRLSVSGLSSRRYGSLVLIVEKALACILMFLMNYSYPGPNATKVSLWGFRLLILVQSLVHGLALISVSFHLGFKIIPEAHYLNGTMPEVGPTDEPPTHEYDSRSVALITCDGAFRAATFWFFLNKLFKPRKDLFVPVYEDLPRDSDEDE